MFVCVRMPRGLRSHTNDIAGKYAMSQHHLQQIMSNYHYLAIHAAIA